MYTYDRPTLSDRQPNVTNFTAETSNSDEKSDENQVKLQKQLIQLTQMFNLHLIDFHVHSHLLQWLTVPTEYLIPDYMSVRRCFKSSMTHTGV